MPQYALSLTLPTVFTEENFFVSGCNREAWQWIAAWPNWRALLLHGPEGSGKSHLGHLWAEKAQAATIEAKNLGQEEPQKGNWLIEDIEQVAQERTLLHWFNYTKENGGSLLMTSRLSPRELPFTLPDLTSRLMAVAAAHIEQPDDEALRGVIRKQFADRQMKVDEEVISYLVPRMERSLAKARELVETLDKAALAEGKNITIPFVRKILEGNLSLF
jgi:DnaA regulatory inactivator Hda